MSAIPTPETTPHQGRDAKGRFAKGNLGGPGNPFARQCATFRKVLHEMVTEDDIRDLAAALLVQARAGDLRAIKLLFSYVIGKPTEAPDPDRLDLEEWQLLRASIPTTDEAEAATQSVPVDFCLKVARVNRDVQDAQLTRQLLEGLGFPEKGQAYEEAILGPRVERADPSPPSANGVSVEVPPSANGATAAPPPSTNKMPRRRSSAIGPSVAAAAEDFADEVPSPNGGLVGVVLDQLFAGMTAGERDRFQGYLERQFVPSGPPPSPNGAAGWPLTPEA